jgi:hypothetical protein
MAKKLVVINDSGDAYCVDPDSGTISKLDSAPPSTGQESVTALSPAQAEEVGCKEAVAMIIMAKL